MSAAPSSDAAIRPAGPADAAHLATLHAQAFDHPWGEAALAGALAQPFAFALQVGAPASGFILAQAVAGEAEILTLAVAPAARRRGAARALVEAAAAVAEARGVEVMWLEVAEDNAAARALYASAGFTAAGRRPAYYPRPSGPIDALMLKRSLNRTPP